MRQTQNKETRDLHNKYNKWRRRTKSEMSFFEWKTENGLVRDCTKLYIDV